MDIHIAVFLIITFLIIVGFLLLSLADMRCLIMIEKKPKRKDNDLGRNPKIHP